MSRTPSTPAAAAALAVVILMGSGCATSRHITVGDYNNLPSGAYAVVAEVRAKPGMENELRAATLPLVREVRREPHNLLYFLHEDRDTPGRFVFYEIFATKQDFEAHNATPHVQAWFAKLPELANGGVQVVHMQVLGN